MSDTNKIQAQFSKAERYAAFLITNLAKMAKCNLYPVDIKEDIPRSAVLEHTLKSIGNGDGLFLEFGVYKGGTISYVAKRFPGRHLYGFDSFEGFPDDGRSDWKQDFSVIKLPEVPANVSLTKGWFKDTLPGFLASHANHVDFLNIDCDLYSSTNDVLGALARSKRLKPGTVIFFDELINYKQFLWNEMLSLFETLELTGLGVRWLHIHQCVLSFEETVDLLCNQQYPEWGENVEAGFRQQASLVLTDEGVDYGPLLQWPSYRKNVEHYAQKLLSLDSTSLGKIC